jgi:hypothetical protein
LDGAADGHRPEAHQLKPPLLELANFVGLFEAFEDCLHGLGGDWRKFKYARQLGCRDNVARAQSEAHRIEFACVIHRKVWRPATFLFD